MNDDQLLDLTPQDPNQPLSPDENRAMLGWLTGQMEQSMPQDPMMEGQPEEGSPEALISENSAPTQAETMEQPEPQQMEDEGLKAEISEIVKNAVKEEISGLRNEIKQALDDEQEEQTE